MVYSVETCENCVSSGACEGQTGPGGLFPQSIHPGTEAQDQASAAKPGLLPNFQSRAETDSEKRGEEDKSEFCHCRGKLYESVCDMPYIPAFILNRLTS